MSRKSRTSRPLSSVVTETLEQRRMLSSSLVGGVLTITGTSGNDTVLLRYNTGATNLTVHDNGVQTNYAYASISTIDVDLGDGNDSFDGQTTIFKSTTIWGGAGSDTIRGSAGADAMNGGDGDDVLLGRKGADQYNGGDGIDRAELNESRSGNPGITVTLDDNADDGESGESDNVASDIENVSTGAGNDYIVGSSLNNSLFGSNGNDTIVGGDGDDTLMGGVGADDLDGGNGIDTADYSLHNTGFTVSLDGVANDTDGTAGENCRGTIENILGGAYADYIVGSSSDNVLSGQGGNDTIYGGDGNDSIDGGIHNDYIDGEGGDDTLIGGKNNDTLIGGAGADTFYSSGDSNAIDVLYVQLLIDTVASSDLLDLIIPVL